MWKSNIVTKVLMSQQQLGISVAKSLNNNQMQLVHKPAKLVLNCIKIISEFQDCVHFYFR